MQYLLLIYGNQSEAPDEDLMPEYLTYTQELVQSGKLRGGEELTDPQTATLVKVRDGERLVTDGPYSETKEHLGGFYLIEADDLDEAIGWAAKIPGAKHGLIEVRACVDHSQDR